MRPAQTTFSFITNPGVPNMGYFLISDQSVTLMTAASIAIVAITFRAIASTFLQFSQPEPRTFTVSVSDLHVTIFESAFSTNKKG
jgi:hypothetical protein